MKLSTVKLTYPQSPLSRPGASYISSYPQQSPLGEKGGSKIFDIYVVKKVSIDNSKMTRGMLLKPIENDLINPNFLHVIQDTSPCLA